MALGGVKTVFILMGHYTSEAGARTARPAAWAHKQARCQMDLLEQLETERHTRKLAETLRANRQRAIVSGQERLALRAQSLANQMARQNPNVAQALTWAQSLCQIGRPLAPKSAELETQTDLESCEPQGDHPAISTFLARIAHEMRTPLTGIVGMAALLDDTVLTPEQRLFADTIKSSATAALVIAQDILDYGKITAQGIEYLAEPFDLERLIHDLITQMQPAAHTKGLRLLVDFDPTLPPHFIGDAGRVRQILTNLLGNAVKFTAKGHVAIKVVGLDVGEGAHHVHITVEDTGIGIAPDDLEAIFDEYHQATPNSGLGLGLTLAKRLLEGMGGVMWVDSELGQGSSFGLRLPLPVATAPVVRADPPALAELAATPRPMRILAAEDNRTNQLVFQKMVRDLAVEVVFANNGAEAVDLFQSFKPDLIFMDIAMPQMNGHQAALAIRQIEAGQSHLPIIALTAQVAEDETAPSLAAGIDRHMTKPLQKAALCEVMTAFCPKSAYVLTPAVELASAGG